MQVINHERINGIYKCVVQYNGERYTRREESRKIIWSGPTSTGWDENQLEQVFNKEKKY